MSDAVRKYFTRDSCDLWDILCDGEYFEVSFLLADFTRKSEVLIGCLGFGHLYNSSLLDSCHWCVSLWRHHSQGSIELKVRNSMGLGRT